METEIKFEPVSFNSDCPIYAEASVSSDKPVLALLHGFLMSRAIWSANINDLSEQFRLVRIEWPGHGRAGTTRDDSSYQISSIIQALDAIRRALGADTWSLCAHSFGAGLAIRYGLAFPDQTLAIAMTNSRSALGALDSSPDDLRRACQALENDGLAALKKMPAHPRFMKNIAAPLKDELLDDAERIDPTAVAKLLRLASVHTNIMDDLANLKPPLMLLNGILESGFQASREAIERNHPCIEIVDLQAGHSPNAESPTAFNAATVEFFKRHSQQE